MIKTYAATDAARAWLTRYQGVKPAFACVLGFTETGLIPNISAAGTTPAARRYTALADGEFLANSHEYNVAHPKRTLSLPPLAAGISPAFITKAVLSQQQIPLHLLSTGLPNALRAPHIALPHVIAKAVNTGQAMTREQAMCLLASGLHWGQQLAQPHRYLIVGEAIVGGTTTAQAVLSALGVKAQGLVSSSHRHSNHRQKQILVEQGLSRWRGGNHHLSALAAVAAVGDPMQIVVAGMALAASRSGGVLLAGGSQMLAVYALAKTLAQEQSIPWNAEQVVVGTTRWVIEDNSADTVLIANDICAPYIASQINFSQSPYFQLRAYERGFIKEGVGAGGCAIAAYLHQNWTCTQLRHAVEAILRQYL